MVASARAGSALVGASAGRADEEAEGREGMITSRGYGKPLRSTLRILVIDDHHLFAEAIEATLARLASQVQVRTVATAEAALLELEKGKRCRSGAPRSGPPRAPGARSVRGDHRAGRTERPWCW
jgi:hypothetical protein